MQNHQIRVVIEYAELNAKAYKLSTFISSEAFKSVDPEEQKRLFSQRSIMLDYLSILLARISAF